MRKYDFTLAKKIIDMHHNLGVLESATLGMHEDWFWTAQEVWRKGEYTNKDLEDFIEGMEPVNIVSPGESKWATPVILLEFEGEDYKYFNCYTGEWSMDPLERIMWMNEQTNGPVSSEIQALREDLEIFNFEENA